MERILHTRDLLAAFPELAEHARPGTALNPRSGAPGVGDSSVGGPLMWPADEPWPMCAEVHLVEQREPLTAAEREEWQRLGDARTERARRSTPDWLVATDEETRALNRILGNADNLSLASWERIGMRPDPRQDPVAMVPLLQLYGRDVPGGLPGLAGPEAGRSRDQGLADVDAAVHSAAHAEVDIAGNAGAGLLQVLWCPNDHAPQTSPGGYPYGGPRFALRRRWEAAAHPPASAPPPPWRADDDYLPNPCAVGPAMIADLPTGDELPEDLRERALAWSHVRGIDYDADVACLRAWKLGGRPSWNVTDPQQLTCPAPGCGAPLRLWLTLDDHTDDAAVSFGSWSQIRLFACPADASHPAVPNLQ